MKWLKLAAIAAAGTAVLLGCQKKVDTAAIADQLQRDAAEWAQAYNAGDADKIAGLYAADGVLMPPHAPAAVGSDAIRQYIAEDSGRAKANGLTLAIESAASGASGDLAWHSGTYSITDGSGNSVDTGKFVELRQNVGGSWKIIRDIWNSDQPPPAPPADAAAQTPAS
jgi:ketosteroid isomerase-like protein